MKIVREDETEQREHEEKTGDVKKPIVAKRLVAAAGRIARAVALVRVMVVMAHRVLYLNDCAQPNMELEFGNISLRKPQGSVLSQPPSS